MVDAAIVGERAPRTSFQGDPEEAAPVVMKETSVAFRLLLLILVQVVAE